MPTLYRPAHSFAPGHDARSTSTLATCLRGRMCWRLTSIGNTAMTAHTASTCNLSHIASTCNL